MRRLNVFLIAFLVGFFGNGCAKRAAVQPDYPVVNRGSYAYQRVNDGEYVVEARNQKSFDAALDEIGCGKAFVCLINREGDVFDVQQRKK
jgi:hypothetical protein